MTQTISLAMIVRNEAANLADCLNSVKGEVDEIIIVDTGSSDQTLNIARNFTEKIYHYKWNNDFSAARNFAISKCSGQWILSLDADEKLNSDAGSLRQLVCNNMEAEAFLLPLFIGPDMYGDQFSVLRLFRNTAKYRFAGKVHEQILIADPTVVRAVAAPVIMHKFIPRNERNKKRQRNLQLLQQLLAADPDNYFLKYYLGVEWFGFGKYDKALQYLREAVAGISLQQVLFRSPAIRYMIDCLKLLGRLDEAFNLCQQECQLYPEYTDLFFDAGAILEEQGEFRKAIDYFHRAIHLGNPPLAFYHTKGTESFLAFHHVGFCYEKTGRPDLADNYYRQALNANPAYVGSLYSLFLAKITNLTPSAAFEYFKSLNFFENNNWAEALAVLFFDFGLPAFAVQCYRQSSVNWRNSVNWVKSLLYSGSAQEALNITASMAKEKVSADIAVDTIIAHIICGDHHTAKQQALALWQNSPSDRSKAWALLTIIARLNSCPGYTKPEFSRELEVSQIFLSILENCLRFKSPGTNLTENGLAYRKLTQAIIDILVESSVISYKCLLDYLQGKIQEVYTLLDYKYAPARGLYL